MQVYKAAWCVFHARGKCTRGNNCSFAHSAEELRQLPDLRKTKLCNAFLGGQCSNNNCSYAHGLQELRDFPGKKGLCRLYREGKCLHGSSCKYAHALGELEVGYVFAQPAHDQPQNQQHFMMAHREQQQQPQQQQLQSLVPDSSLPQDLLLLQQLAMQQAHGKLTRQQQQQQQHMVEHQQLLMLLEAEAAGKAAVSSQEDQRAQMLQHPEQQQQQQQALKRQIQDLQQRCFASDLHSQQQSQQQQDGLPQFQTGLTSGRLPQQQNEHKDQLPQQEVVAAVRSPGSLQFRLPSSKVPALSLRALAAKQQQHQYQQQRSEDQLLQQLQSTDSWSEAPGIMQISSGAPEATQQQLQQQKSAELEEVVSRQQLVHQRLLLQQQRRLPGSQQAFAEAVLQHGWQRPAAGSADEAAVSAATAAAPGYYRDLNPWGQAVSRSTASTATGDDCYSFASLAAAAAVRKAEQSLKPPSPEDLQRQQQPPQQPQMMQQLQQQSLSRQGRELLQAVELLRHQQKHHQGEQVQQKEAHWTLHVEMPNTETAPVVSPFGNYSLREMQSRMASLALQPQQQLSGQQMEQQRQQQQLEHHRQLEGFLAQLARDQTEGLSALSGKESLCGSEAQHQQQLQQQQREQPHHLPKLQLPSGIAGSAAASYRLGKSPLHRPNGEDTPCIQQSFSTFTAQLSDPTSCTRQLQEHDAINDDREAHRQTAKFAAAAQCDCTTTYSDERAAAPPQRLSTIKSEDEGQDSDGERGHTQQLQQQQTLQQRLAEGKVPLVV